jgi:hypothetical protein
MNNLRKDLFWLTVSEDSVHCFGPVGGWAEHYGIVEQNCSPHGSQKVKRVREHRNKIAV